MRRAKLKKEEKRLLSVLLNDPHQLKYLKHTVNHRFYLSTMNKFFGRNIGLEIENLSCASVRWAAKNKPRLLDKREIVKTQKLIRKKYNFVSFSNEGVWNWDEHIFAEQAIRLDGYKSSQGLFDWLQFCSENLIVNDTGGIHIHVDFTKEFEKEYIFSAENTLKKYITQSRVNRDSELMFFVRKIFNYTGSYNGHHFSGSKGGCVSFRSEFKTIEYRMGYCTFEYKKIIQWIICCTLWTESISKGQPLNRKICEEVMSLWYNNNI